MNTITELNTAGSLSLTVTDDRPSGVIFDRVYPLLPIDQILNVTSTTVSVSEGINIVEVINYATANVRYQIKIVSSLTNPLTGSSITWPSLPSGVVLSVVGNTYTLTGINTAAIWEQIKDFTWNLPANYATKPLWFLEVSVIYYSSSLGADVSVEWLAYDEDYFYVSEMISSSSLTCVGQDARLMSASLVCVTALTVDPKLLEGIINTVQSNFSLSCNARLKPKDGEFQSVFSLVGNGRYSIGGLRSNQVVTSSISCNLSALITNIITRTYISNSENSPFVVDTPFIDDPDPATTSTFTLQISATNGTWASSSTSAYSNPLTISGTKSQINNAFSQIKFYPTKNSTSNGTATIILQKDSVTQATRTFAINFASAGPAYSPKYFVFTRTNIWFNKTAGITYPSNYYFLDADETVSWSPPNYDLIYGSQGSILLLGSGANGDSGWSTIQGTASQARIVNDILYTGDVTGVVKVGMEVVGTSINPQTRILEVISVPAGEPVYRVNISQNTPFESVTCRYPNTTGNSLTGGVGGGAGGYYYYTNFSFVPGTVYTIAPGDVNTRLNSSRVLQYTTFSYPGGSLPGAASQPYPGLFCYNSAFNRGVGWTSPNDQGAGANGWNPGLDSGNSRNNGGGGSNSELGKNATDSAGGAGGQGASISIFPSVFYNIPLPDLFNSSTTSQPGYVTLNLLGRFGAGGGGGAGGAGDLGGAGGAGGAGSGGIANATTSPGGDADFYASAGGGGGAVSNSVYSPIGGKGAPGLVVIYFS